MDSRAAFLAFEAELDQTIKQLPVLQLPFRTVLSALYGVVDARFHGSRSASPGYQDEDVGHAIIGRLSYLLPHLAACPIHPLGTSAANALSPLDTGMWAQIHLLLSYSHFCELMPEFHRGYYSVSGDKEAGFTLVHSDATFRHYEARDITLTELSIPFFERRYGGFERNVDAMVDDLVKQKLLGRRVEVPLLLAIAKEYYERTKGGIRELPVLTEEGCLAAFGVSQEKFNRFRSAWVGIGEACLTFADGFSRRAKVSNGRRARELLHECFEWMAPLLKATFLEGTVMGLARLSAHEIEHLMRIFSYTPGKETPASVGDGFFPPFARLDDSLLFNPDALRSRLSSRNVLYALNRADTKRFDEEVSAHLEPALLGTARHSLEQLPNVRLAQEVIWARGELDLLVYSVSENKALHIQAKAPIAPQGARMVKATEGRVKEGLKQLAEFRKLPATEIDKIIGDAVGLKVNGVQLVDAVLCRASFGTAKVWESLGQACALNPAILAAVVARLNEQATPTPIGDFAATTRAVTDDLQARIVKGWQEATIDIGETKLTMPLLQLNYDVIRAELRLSHERLAVR